VRARNQRALEDAMKKHGAQRGEMRASARYCSVLLCTVSIASQLKWSE
jgi:hypothetical protein